MIDFTPFLRLYGSWRNSRRSRLDPVKTQRELLLSLLSKARDTQFGKDHGFGEINSVEEFQKQVPLRRYEAFWEEYMEPHFPVLENVLWPGKVPYFSVSSGTSSGSTKYLPYNKEISRSNTKAGMDLLVHHVQNCPQSKIFGGKNFMLGGSTELKEEAPGVWSGDLSGISVKELPWWIEPRYFPPKELALIKDWEEKIDVLAKASLQTDIRMLGGVPSWLLIFIDKLEELNPGKERRLVNYFPNLEMLVHGGVSFEPYKQQFEELLEGSGAELREVYPASEGFVATADRGYGEGLLLNLDHGIFYEFVPFEELEDENPTRHWIGDVEAGVNYAIVLSTCAGLWGYVLGDTVRFVDTNPPRLLITGRTSYYLSAFGEHLIAEEVEDAVSSAAETIGVQLKDYSVGAVFPQESGEKGCHRYIVEIEDGKISEQQIEPFREKIDERLCKRNEDYEAHRSEGFGLGDPEIVPVRPGFFADWMKSRGKLGGQNKVPRLVSKQELFEDLCRYADDHG